METCFECAIKHLGQAYVLLKESKLGYPIHKYYAIGHMAEAESELAEKYSHLGESIREARKILFETNTTPDFESLINMILKEIGELDA